MFWVMFGAVCQPHNERMDSEPATPTLPGALAERAKAAGLVRLTRFTVPPDRRAELIDAVRATPSTPVTQETDCRRSVGFEDGYWLEISITSGGALPNQGPQPAWPWRRDPGQRERESRFARGPRRRSEDAFASGY